MLQVSDAVELDEPAHCGVAGSTVILHSMQLSLGTWNLDRSGARNTSRWQTQLQEITRKQCDLWVLTEAHRGQLVSPGMHSAFSAPGSGIYHASECAVALWSRWPLQILEVADPRLSVCAMVRIPGCDREVIVYGTVIPYANDGVAAGEAKRWQRHEQAVDALMTDCARLRQEDPSRLVIIAGDFNMNMDGTHWYGLNATKRRLLSVSESLGFICHTSQDIRKERNMPRASVDHIWTTSNAQPAVRPDYWMSDSSDHNGVSVKLKTE